MSVRSSNAIVPKKMTMLTAKNWTNASLPPA
jgi:hypothetical protein